MACKYYCNLCGNHFDEADEHNDFSIHTLIGYGSKHDGEILTLDLCCDCMDKLIDACQIEPVREVDPEYDLILGDIYDD